jgi:hypothetical protein
MKSFLESAVHSVKQGDGRCSITNGSHNRAFIGDVALGLADIAAKTDHSEVPVEHKGILDEVEFLLIFRELPQEPEEVSSLYDEQIRELTRSCTSHPRSSEEADLTETRFALKPSEYSACSLKENYDLALLHKVHARSRYLITNGNQILTLNNSSSGETNYSFRISAIW